AVARAVFPVAFRDSIASQCITNCQYCCYDAFRPQTVDGVAWHPIYPCNVRAVLLGEPIAVQTPLHASHAGHTLSGVVLPPRLVANPACFPPTLCNGGRAC